MAKPPIDDRSQRDRFIEAAHELGAGDDEATFKAKLAVIGRHNPKPHQAGGEDALQSGIDAYAAGKDISDNPYPEQDSKHTDWHAGWYSAEKRDRA